MPPKTIKSFIPSHTEKGDPNIPYGPEQKAWKDEVPAGAVISDPVENPAAVYPQVPPTNVVGDFPKIDYTEFEIPPSGLTEKQREKALASFKKFADMQHKNFSGFQANQDQSYSQSLSWLLDMHSNNIGDPYSTGDFTLNSKFCERAVLDYFAALWNAPWPHHDQTADAKYGERYWGYVLTMGFTEGNIYGMYNARDYLKGRILLEDPQSEEKANQKLMRGKERAEKKVFYANPKEHDENPNAYTPIVFYSEDVHYSVIKAVSVLELQTFYQEGTAKYPGECPITDDGTWPEEVPSHDYDKDDPLSGTIKVDDLKTLVRFFAGKGYPILLVLNLGTTWKGAYDDVPAINQMLKDLEEEFPWLWERTINYDPIKPGLTDKRRGFWVHVDGALGAPYLPFIEMAHNQGKIDKMVSVFDFRNECVMSLGCSMHKWIGGPWPFWYLYDSY